MDKHRLDLDNYLSLLGCLGGIVLVLWLAPMAAGIGGICGVLLRLALFVFGRPDSVPLTRRYTLVFRLDYEWAVRNKAKAILIGLAEAALAGAILASFFAVACNRSFTSPVGG